MKQVNIHEAKTRFSALVAQVENGEDVIIARSGKPVARIVRATGEAASGSIGYDAGLTYWIADDFDSWLPTEFDEYFR